VSQMGWCNTTGMDVEIVQISVLHTHTRTDRHEGSFHDWVKQSRVVPRLSGHKWCCLCGVCVGLCMAGRSGKRCRMIHDMVGWSIIRFRRFSRARSCLHT
jgi:hypothetical protein